MNNLKIMKTVFKITIKAFIFTMLVIAFNQASLAQEFDSNSYYRLTTQWLGDGKSLDIVNDGTNNQIQMADTGAYSGQQWKITSLGNGYYRLTTQWLGNGKSLDVVNDGTNNKLQMADTGDFSGQFWKFTKIE